MSVGKHTAPFQKNIKEKPMAKFIYGVPQDANKGDFSF